MPFPRSVNSISLRVGACATAVLLLATLAGPRVTSVAAAPAGCTAASGLKPLIRGLVDRKQIPPAANLQGAVIEVNWSDLEPSGPGLVAGNPIDTAIAAAGCTTPLRLRVFAGLAAPEWVKQASGGDVSVTNPFDHTTGTIGRFWTDAFGNAYDNLQSELAAAYDSVPNLDEVVVSRCSMFYPEPFLRGTSIPSNVTSLVDAGYTLAADKKCQLDEIDSSVNAWTTVRVGVAFNPYQVVNSDYSFGTDEGYTEQVMGYCRQTAGPRCVLENDSIRDPISGLISQYGPMYAAMSSLGAPIAIQTAVAARIGDFWGTLVWARQHHAASVELPVDGSYPTAGGAGAPPWQTLAEVAQWFQEDPALTAVPLAAVEGSATTGMALASLSLDERAAVDTLGGYGDVGSVPFDTVSAVVDWPDGAQEAALLTLGQGGTSASVTCPQQLTCAVTIESGGHAVAEEAPAAPATVNVTLALAGVAYVPADGIRPSVAPAVSASDAALSLVKAHIIPSHAPHKIRFSIVFADADPGGLSSDYTVTVTWGDGSTSVLAATAVNGGFSAGDTHVYPGKGTYKVQAAILDAGGAALAVKRLARVT